MLGVPGDVPGWPTAAEHWADPDPLTTAAAEALVDEPDAPFEVLPPAVRSLHAALLSATAELRPTESSLKSSRTRLFQSLGELQNQLSGAGHEYRPDWATDDDRSSS